MKSSPLRAPMLLTALCLYGCVADIGGQGITGDTEDTNDTGDTGDDPGGEFETPGQCPGGDAAFETLMLKVRSEVEKTKAPGVAIAIVCGGKLAHTGTVGQRKVGGEDIAFDTRFQLASLTKMFTAAAAANLASQGLIDLDLPISTYLPGLSFGEITLRALLSHSAGFPTDFDSYAGSSLVGMANANATMNMWADSGQVWNYSNIGYVIAGAVLESATGRSLTNILEDEVFAPADMKDATLNSSAVSSGGNFAYGHEGSAASPTVYGPLDSYYHTVDYGPMGGAWGSVTDLAKWAEAHMAASDPLGNGVMQELRKKHFRTGSSGQSYGLGHFVEDSQPLMVHHGGSVTGFLADFSFYPQSGFAVVVVGNSDWFDPGAISKFAEAAYLGEIQRAEGQTPATDAQIIGSYNDPAVFGNIVVRSAGQGLEIQFVDKGITSPLVPWWGNTYGTSYGTMGEIDISFWNEPGQDASHIVSLYGVAKRSP